MTEGRVVVTSPVTMLKSADGLFAASFKKMGLTGFGHTPEEATEALKLVFATWIDACRERGILAEYLDRLKVEWEWESERAADAPAYEDVSSRAGTEEEAVEVEEVPVWSPEEAFPNRALVMA